MKFLINLFVFVFFLFFLNILLYSTNTDYHNLIKGIKYSYNDLWEDKILSSDTNNTSSADISLSNKSNVSSLNIIEEDLFDENIDDNIEKLSNTWVLIISTWSNVIDIENELSDIEKIEDELEKQWDKIELEDVELELSLVDKDILSKFNYLDFKESDYVSSLFWITNEYPEEYLEYSSSKIDILFFLDQDYKKIYDFFDIVSFDMPFSVKEVNNFWDKSFYINLDKSDNYVRIVFSKYNRTYWLKILESEYSNVKDILQTIK